jgi:Raf kinase inhibitor-like YbhB/YbcL family protein
MGNQFSVNIDAWAHGTAIPPRFAFGKPGVDSPFAPSENLNPTIRWSKAPQGTKSFTLICHDPDVPSSGDDVNQKGKIVPEDLTRTTFYHWVCIDIDTRISSIIEGTESMGITARGKPVGSTENGINGINDYTGWFTGDPDMEGIYGGYDGPCPPWNDSIIHHYHFEVFALDIKSLGLQGEFTGSDTLKAMQGHILSSDSHMGTYTMNPAIGS